MYIKVYIFIDVYTYITKNMMGFKEINMNYPENLSDLKEFQKILEQACLKLFKEDTSHDP